MNTTQTLEQMQQLRLQGMYQAYRSQLELPWISNWKDMTGSPTDTIGRT